MEISLQKENYEHLISDIARLKVENDIMMEALMEYAFMPNNAIVLPGVALRALRKIRRIEKTNKLD